MWARMSGGFHIEQRGREFAIVRHYPKHLGQSPALRWLASRSHCNDVASLLQCSSRSRSADRVHGSSHSPVSSFESRDEARGVFQLGWLFREFP